jgi:hypothetical protein
MKPKETTAKEWAYIRCPDLDFEDEWYYKDGDKWIASDDTYYNVDGDGIEILATHKSVTMPDWVPADLDKLDYNPEDVAFSAKLVPEKITLSEEDFDNFVNKCENTESSEVTNYLPSLGEVCNVELGNGKTVVATIVGNKLNGCLIWESNNLTDAYRHPEAQVGKFSPYISEEDKVLQKASSIISNGCLTEELKMLYDAGMLRLPEGE